MKIILFVGLFLSGFNLSAQVKVGVIDRELLLDSLPSRIRFLEEREQIENTKSAKLREMDTIMESLIAEFNRSSNRCEVGNRMLNQQCAYKTEADKIEKEMKNLDDESLRKCNSIIDQAAGIVSKRLFLDMVIDDTIAIYHNSKLEITNQVMMEMLKIDQP